jgi:hypothetical protein
LEDELKRIKSEKRASEADDSWMPPTREEMENGGGHNRKIF